MLTPHPLATYIQHMGDDKSVVRAARISFNLDSQTDATITERDASLIHFLARGCSSDDWATVIQEIQDEGLSDAHLQDILHAVRAMPTHFTPFTHQTITMRETLPIFVARQRFKHTVGFTYNEVSRRYVDDAPEIFTPPVWRSRPEDSIKQGSGDAHPNNGLISAMYDQRMKDAVNFYQWLLDEGVAPEQARMALPQSMMTSYWVTGSLYAWANAFIQRSNSHAQAEIREMSEQWESIIEPLFPVAWKALTSAAIYR